MFSAEDLFRDLDPQTITPQSEFNVDVHSTEEDVADEDSFVDGIIASDEQYSSAEQYISDEESVSDVSDGDVTLDSCDNFNSTHGGQVVMFKESNMTTYDVVVLVTTFALYSGISNLARQHLFELFKMCAGPRFKNYNVSNYKFDKILDIPNTTITSHYYCAKCFKKIYSSHKNCFQRQEIICSCTQKEFIDLNSENNFLTVDLEYQLKQIMKDSSICAAFISNEMNKSSVELNDIKQGKLYPKSDRPTLVLSCSTDGAPIFHKSKRSMWPLQFIINNLPPVERFQNVLIAGLMIVPKEPKPELMNTFMQTFINDVKELDSRGFEIQINDNGLTQLFGISVICCSVDSVARAVCQNRIQYNGYYGCSYCYIMGKYETTLCFPFSEKADELRTHESHMNDLNAVLNVSKVQGRGVKGISIFTELPGFNMVWGFPFDVMHTVELGVTNFLWNLLFKTIKKDKKNKINDRLMKIKPPHDVGILPKEIYDLKNYKAKHWRSFLLYYSIPIVADILSDDFKRHYALLVKSIYILLKDHISESDLDECEEDLIKFVGLFQILHGSNSMRFNVHLLLHVVDSVRHSGPLWSTSTYPYEGNIYYMKKTYKRPKRSRTTNFAKILKNKITYTRASKSIRQSSAMSGL